MGNEYRAPKVGTLDGMLGRGEQQAIGWPRDQSDSSFRLEAQHRHATLAGRAPAPFLAFGSVPVARYERQPSDGEVICYRFSDSIEETP